MKAFHPDDTGMVLADGGDRKRDNKKGGGGGGGNAMLDPFFPGQKGALARQLNMGFGGGLKNWRQSIDASYAPFRNAVLFPYGKGISLGNGDTMTPVNAMVTNAGGRLRYTVRG